MKGLYSSPLRVYLCLALLAAIGIYSGLKLPVSLFPNSSKPRIHVSIPYGSDTPIQFLNDYGLDLESQIRKISTETVQIDKLTANYSSDSAEYDVEFKWGAPPKPALKEVQTVVHSFEGRFPDEIRKNVWISARNRTGGFFALSFYSSQRSLDELYAILEPVLGPRISKVPDAENPGLWNPSKKEIRIELIPEKMAALRLFPKDLDAAISHALTGQNGGSVTIGPDHLTVQMPRQVSKLEDLSTVLVPTPSGRVVHLSDVAHIDFGPNLNSDDDSVKTNGSPAIILFARPKADGNVKRMAEDLLQIVEEETAHLPKDIQYRKVVDPSEFIRDAVANVFHEVLIGAMLAVCVLFLFIGSLKNTITAAIEIPLSMVLAFILMRISGMNMNLISLGGLALSSGMNVDASVVVMENIFRHFEERAKNANPLFWPEKLNIIVKAVREVQFSVIASTVASLVVFLPLAFTSDLSYAILGDLAKTVVFSHGFSAFVALILVPTVRLQLLAKPGSEKPHHSPIEPQIRKLEDWYGRSLDRFITDAKLQKKAFLGVAALLAILIVAILPTLPKELIGKPDTDWIQINVGTSGNTLSRQMETQLDEIEARFLKKYGSKIEYTFQEYGANWGQVMGRLKDKRDMTEIWHSLEREFTNTPSTHFDISPWNPAELPIPDPPQMRLVVRGGSDQERANLAERLKDDIEKSQDFPINTTTPSVGRTQAILIRPHFALWSSSPEAAKMGFLPQDLADLARVATDGRRVGYLEVNHAYTEINLRYPQGMIDNEAKIASLPIAVGSKIVPLKSFATVQVENVDPNIYREDERSLIKIEGKMNHGDESKAADALRKTQKRLESFAVDPKNEGTARFYFEDSLKDMHEALRELSVAVGLSILLIFLALLVQFGSLMNAMLVMVAVPLGFIGVLVSLFVFRSTLSLNSVLGVILLNGIAVANSILLVDFIRRYAEKGYSAKAAAIEAGRKRLRPILITSLTTILGMLPIALGLGDGGRILQPLGIAVSGGLWVSMSLTLFLVPVLQVKYLQSRWGQKQLQKARSAETSVPVQEKIDEFDQPDEDDHFPGLQAQKKKRAKESKKPLYS